MMKLHFEIFLLFELHCIQVLEAMRRDIFSFSRTQQQFKISHHSQFYDILFLLLLQDFLMMLCKRRRRKNANKRNILDCGHVFQFIGINFLTTFFFF